eukprot:6374123-Amphidinium_carterae.1
MEPFYTMSKGVAPPPRFCAPGEGRAQNCVEELKPSAQRDVRAKQLVSCSLEFPPSSGNGSFHCATQLPLCYQRNHP